MMLQAVAHDVKNKLAELAMRLLEFDTDAAALALDAAERLTHALLLDNPDQLIPQIEAHCPIDLAEEMVAVYTQLFPNKSVIADVRAAPNIWFYDKELMRLAISNAMHNACKHGLQKITLRFFVENEYLVIEVRNDGEEFPDAILNTEWQSAMPYAQPSQTHPTMSTGIGLLLSHKIVCAHTNEKDGQTRCGHLLLSNDHGAVARLVVP